jgi:flagellar basal-body rod protein FlgF
MDIAGYATLSRQSGLMREMQVVANNIANAATTGYRQEGLIFSEYVQDIEGAAPVSMAHANARATSQVQGALTSTGGTFDLAIEGDGYFLIDGPLGERLTRSGAFTPDAAGNLVTSDGHRLLDGDRAPVFVPPGADGVHVAADGTVSVGDQPVSRVGLYLPEDPVTLTREDGVMFRADGTVRTEDARIVQGHLEGSNVDAISQLARMIEIQRSYEMGQSFLKTEDERIRNSIKSLLK